MCSSVFFFLRSSSRLGVFAFEEHAAAEGFALS
jgi:hypothetical protein